MCSCLRCVIYPAGAVGDTGTSGGPGVVAEVGGRGPDFFDIFCMDLAVTFVTVECYVLSLVRQRVNLSNELQPTDMGDTLLTQATYAGDSQALLLFQCDCKFA